MWFYIYDLGWSVALIILGIQFRRGKWLGLLAGNTFRDKPIDVQRKAGKGASIFLFIMAPLPILICLFEWQNLNIKWLLIFYLGPLLIYAFIVIVMYIKHFIKYGE